MAMSKPLPPAAAGGPSRKSAARPRAEPRQKAPGRADRRPAASGRAPAAGLRPLRVAVLASGRGSNLDALLRHIRSGLVNAKVTLVLSDRPDAGALDVARKAGVPAVVGLVREAGEKAAAYNARLVEVLLKEAPELIVLAGYMRIVGRPVLAAFPNRIINIHPGLLPSFKGLHAVQQALEAGAKIAGCSTHYVTGDLDGGPIILQAAIDVRPGQSLGELQRRILQLEHLVLPRTVQLFAEGRVRSEGAKSVIAPGASWLKGGPRLVAGALYSDGF